MRSIQPQDVPASFVPRDHSHYYADNPRSGTSGDNGQHGASRHKSNSGNVHVRTDEMLIRIQFLHQREKQKAKIEKSCFQKKRFRTHASVQNRKPRTSSTQSQWLCNTLYQLHLRSCQFSVVGTCRLHHDKNVDHSIRELNMWPLNRFLTP